MKNCTFSQTHNWHIILFIFLIAIFTSCNEQSERVQIEKSQSSSSLKAESSTFCMPIEIPLNELEDLINKKVKQNLIVNKRVDNSTLINANRVGKVTIGAFQNKALFTIPLDVSVQKGIKIKLLTLDFKLNLQVLSDVSIEKNYDISTDSEIHNIVWVENPEISFLGLDFDLKKLVDKELRGQKNLIAQAIDNSIKGKINVERSLSKVWNDMQAPQSLLKNKKDSLFILIRPNTIKYNSHTINKQVIRIDLQSTSHFYLRSSLSNNPKAPVRLPRLRKSKSKCKGFSISLLADLKFTDINRKINSILKGKSRGFDGYEVEFDSVEFKPSGQNLYVNLKTKGDYAANMEGIVGFDIDTLKQEISGELKAFKLLNGDLEVEVANAIFGDYVLEQINNYNGFNYTSYLKEVPGLITKGINKGKSGDKWHPVFDNMDIKIQQFQISEEGIHFKVKGEGNGKIVIDQLNAKK